MPLARPLTSPLRAPLSRPFGSGGRTLIQRAIAILRRFGQDAHIYLPGVGMLNGLQAANYISSNGTEPGEVDQPVGLVLDAGGGLGVELVVNGALNDASGWSLGTGWAISGGVAVKTAGTGSLLTNTSGTATAANKTYLVECDVSGCTAGSIQFDTSGVTSALSASGFNGRYTSVVRPTSGTSVPKIWATTTFNGTVDNISVREVTGIHAQQPTTASKPLLRRGAVNLLTYSGDFSNAAWSKLRSTVSGTTITATETTGNGFHISRSAGAPLGLLTFAAVVSRGSTDFCAMTLFDGANGVRQWFNLASGQVSDVFIFGSGVTSVQASVEAIGDGKLLISCTVNMPSGTPQIVLYPAVSAPSALSCTLGDTGTVHAAATFQGTYTAPQIQALGGIPLTTTAPASTALGAHFWQFDGSNDSLSLGGPLFQMSDDHCVVLAASTNKLAVTSEIFTQRNSASANAICPAIRFDATGKILSYLRDDASVFSVAQGRTYAAGTTYAISVRKNGGTTTLLCNSDDAVTVTNTFGATTLNTASIGVTNSTTHSGYMSGGIYPIVAIKGTVTAAEHLLLHKFLAQIAGVQI